MECLRTLEVLKNDRIHVTTEGNTLKFTRADEEASAAVTLASMSAELEEKLVFQWQDILFMISLARASDKSKLALGFFPDRLEAVTAIAGAKYQMTIARIVDNS